VDPTAWAGLLSPVGCVIFLVVALARGWLVSGREMDRHEKIWEARLVEAHERELIWQKTAETREETSRDALDQLRTRQIVDETVVKTIAALPQVAPSGGV
jgi:hypothetical protein